MAGISGMGSWQTKHLCILTSYYLIFCGIFEFFLAQNFKNKVLTVRKKSTLRISSDHWLKMSGHQLSKMGNNDVMWHVTYKRGMWYVTYDTHGILNIASKFKVPSSNGFKDCFVWRFPLHGYLYIHMLYHISFNFIFFWHLESLYQLNNILLGLLNWSAPAVVSLFSFALWKIPHTGDTNFLDRCG